MPESVVFWPYRTGLASLQEIRIDDGAPPPDYFDRFDPPAYAPPSIAAAAAAESLQPDASESTPLLLSTSRTFVN